MLEVLRTLDVSAEEATDVVGQDIGMTAKVLQMANSALFGLQRPVTNPAQAVIYLGTEVVRQLVGRPGAAH